MSLRAALPLLVLLAGRPVLAAGPAAVPASPPSVAAVPHPAARFAGRWQLDLAHSDMGKPRRATVAREDVIVADGPWLHVRSVAVRAGNDSLKLEYRYRVDGDAMNTLMGQEVKTRGHMAGGTLHLDSEAKLLLLTLLVSEHWNVSADGRTLTLERESRSPLGDEKQKLVFARR
ncbi:MAG: hypothetical protein ABL977_05225 [Candidatus Eisenbacteria bacterium]